MDDIYIEYATSYCEYYQECFFEYQCAGENAKEYAESHDCPYYNDGTSLMKLVYPDKRYVPYGDCHNVNYDKGYKRISTSNYDIVDNSTEGKVYVTIGKGKNAVEYECSKVVLNGKCLFDYTQKLGGRK